MKPFTVVLLDDFPEVRRVSSISEARELCAKFCRGNPFGRSFICYPDGQWSRSTTNYLERKIHWEFVVDELIPSPVRLATVIA